MQQIQMFLKTARDMRNIRTAFTFCQITDENQRTRRNTESVLKTHQWRSDTSISRNVLMKETDGQSQHNTGPARVQLLQDLGVVLSRVCLKSRYF